MLGTGVVHTYAVSHRSLDPEWQSLAPFATLVVELDEGPRVVAATDLDLAAVAIGLPVALDVLPRNADVAQLWTRVLRR